MVTSSFRAARGAITGDVARRPCAEHPSLCRLRRNIQKNPHGHLLLRECLCLD